MNLIEKRYKSAIDFGWPELDLSNCKIRSFKEIDHIDFSIFFSINLSYNFISNIPVELFRYRNLYEINLQYNCLSGYSDFYIEEFNLSTIKKLNLNGNIINYLPYELASIDEDKEVTIKDNPVLIGLPGSAGDKSILDIMFLLDLSKGEQSTRFFEGKLILVGRGDVGKTSISNKIKNLNYSLPDKPISSTRGVDITAHVLPVEYRFTRVEHYLIEEGDHDRFYFNGIEYSEEYGCYLKNAKINIWDFGGQEIYYNLHQLFLTENAVYILVWDARKEETVEDFDYWLSSIELLGKKSPIILAQNKIDIRRKSIDENDLRSHYKSIVGFNNLSVETGEGFDELIENIVFAFSNISLVNDVIPRYWIDVRNELLSIKKKYITVEEFENLLSPSHKLTLNEKERDRFLKHITQLGRIMYYPNHQMLSDIIILDPEWATSSFYQIIEDAKIQKAYGRFNYLDAKRLWKGNNYPVGCQVYLLQLLCHFDICFNLIGTTEYLIPELFSHDEPGVSIDFSIEDCLSFFWNFNFMPRGIIPRLICSLHTYVIKEQYWRSGVIVSLNDESHARITMNAREKKISVLAVGKEKEKVMLLVRNKMDGILSKLNLTKNVDYLEAVPCRCSICSTDRDKHIYQTKVLENYKEKGRPTIVCSKSVEEIDIDFLMNGYRKGKTTPELLRNILIICGQLQGTAMSVKRGEDDRNTIVCALMKNRGFKGFDQTRWGKSATGKSAGEIDIKFEDGEGLTTGIFEGFNLEYLNRNVIRGHFTKLFNYDPNGLNENFLVVYAESEDFMSLYDKYSNFIPEIPINFEVVEPYLDVSSTYSNGNEIRVGLTGYVKNKKKCYIYHIFVNMKTAANFA